MSILILYKSGGGAQDIEFVQEMPVAVYEAVKRNAIRYLKANLAAPGAIDLLGQFPFRLWQATNDFGDDFEVLYLKAGVHLYVEIEKWVGIWENYIVDGLPSIAHALKTIGHPIRFVAVGLNLDENVADVSDPGLVITSDIVEEALRQAETLIGTHGAPSGLDRVHTAFHAYLESACKNADIEVKPDAGITDLFARLRDQHPALAIADPEDKTRMDQILRGMARIVDALDLIRNRKTLAHPNPLLDEPEARLAINLMRTMLQYLDQRLHGPA